MTPPVRSLRAPSSGAPTGDRTTVPYDFRRPIQLSREQSRILQVAFENYARSCSTSLTSTLRRICSATLRSVEQRSYGEYVASLQHTTYITVFAGEPVEGLCVLNLPMHGVMTCVDHMLGGPGSATQPERPLTDIESSIAQVLVTRLLDDLGADLEGTVAMHPRMVDVEYSPQLIQAGAANDVVVVVTIDLLLGETRTELTLCLPFHGLQPHLANAVAPAPVSERERAVRAHAAGLLRDQLQDIPVGVTVRFRPTQVHPRDLDGLAVGDVIRLSHPASAPLELSADGTTFAYTTPGTQGERLAALVVTTPKENP